MIRAKNYKTVTKFLIVMPRIQWPLFSQTRCIYVWTHNYVDLFNSCTYCILWVKNTVPSFISSSNIACNSL